MPESNVAELALRIAVIALLLALSAALLVMQYIYDPEHKASSRGAKGDASQTPKEGE